MWTRKICVNNSLATKYSISKGWVFFCQRSRGCPGGWVVVRCVSPWETWPGEFPGRRAKRGHAAWVSLGGPVIYLTPPNAVFQSTGVCSAFGKQLEIVVGFLSCLKTWCNSSTERGTKIAVCKISPTSLSHAWEAGVWCSVNGSCKETRKTWPAEVRYGFEQFERRSCSEIFLYRKNIGNIEILPLNIWGWSVWC